MSLYQIMKRKAEDEGSKFDVDKPALQRTVSMINAENEPLRKYLKAVAKNRLPNLNKRQRTSPSPVSSSSSSNGDSKKEKLTIEVLKLTETDGDDVVDAIREMGPTELLRRAELEYAAGHSSFTLNSPMDVDSRSKTISVNYTRESFSTEADQKAALTLLWDVAPPRIRASMRPMYTEVPEHALIFANGELPMRNALEFGCFQTIETMYNRCLEAKKAEYKKDPVLNNSPESNHLPNFIKKFFPNSGVIDLSECTGVVAIHAVRSGWLDEGHKKRPIDIIRLSYQSMKSQVVLTYLQLLVEGSGGEAQQFVGCQRDPDYRFEDYQFDAWHAHLVGKKAKPSVEMWLFETLIQIVCDHASKHFTDILHKQSDVYHHWTL